MLKFMVVLYKKPELSEAEFHRFLRDVHGPMALKIPDCGNIYRTMCLPIPAENILDGARS
jgi:hypothetical protein